MHGLITIDEDSTFESYGHDPYKRPIDALLDYGITLLDKPPGPTSHEVVAWVRRMLGVKKAGHSGTLDPLVTGLLPIGLGEGTKALSLLLLGPKEYYTIARIHIPMTEIKLKKVLSEFTGEIYQRPPQRSSVKRATRTRKIYDLDLIEQSGNLILLRILCQAGTYVRKLIYDMGEVLGSGATMIELRRTRVSNLTEEDGLVRLHDLLDGVHEWKEEGEEDKIRQLVKPIEFATYSMKTAVMRDSAVDAICHGAQLAVPGILQISPNIVKGDTICMYTLKGELVAIGEALMSTEEIVNASKGLAFMTKRVIMKAGTYPDLWRSKKLSSIDDLKEQPK
ncbi:MAG: RNA-guided pseudouridylation complex pseudouridine synthase subunit Cbf5 [Candidatus Methylarchaceae archaeon HK02M1]|nr:RNA-guided pseudouridylation complex pseudouridine synthase subunit Cbf5 [Candidatus Methylarchaceae archaeon HK01M]MCP8312217.1 RNA-guided pseudouridylation complex pseudouridine synthase subunit Cbf5 [Candidatus Methylarchaceae archaeon HK02M1]